MPHTPDTRTRLIHFTAALAVLASLPACREDHDGTGSKPAAATHEDHGHEHADEVKLTAEAVERHGLKLQTAAKHLLTPTFVCPARIGFNSEAMAHVGSPLRGRAVDIMVRLGDKVVKGQNLVVVESAELGEAQSDFLQKRTAAKGAAPQVALAKASWDRARNLQEQTQGISLSEVQRREAEYIAALGAQRGAEAASNAAENHLHVLGMDQPALERLATSGEVAPRFVIRAPIAGQVVQRELTLGELVSPEREALLVLADTSTLWVLADAPEARLGEVVVGAPAWVSIGFLSGDRLETRVGFISPMVDPTTRTAQLRLDITAGNAGALRLRPGMFAQAEITAAAPAGQEAVVAVPEEAVQTVEGAPAVFVPVDGEPNTYAKRAVTVGKSVGGMVPILSGLAEGESYIATGSFILKADLGKSAAKHEH